MKVAIYLRVSTTEQAEEGYSISAQRERLKAYIVSQGWELAETYEDAGFSGGSLNRPAFARMREDIKKRSFDLILVYKLDRLSRNMRDLSNLIHELDEYGIYFKSATEPFDTTTPAGKLIFNMLGSVAEFERGMIGERVKMGMLQKAKEGNGLLGFNHPYGYDYTDSGLDVNEAEARNVRAIYTKYLRGYTLEEIANELNNSGVKTKRSKRWTRQTVLNVLTNPLYAGYNRWGSIYWHGKHHPIVEPDTWNKAQHLRTIRSRQKRAPRLKIEELNNGEFGIFASS
ncbi:MAG: recombinase family protein [Thermoplasmata archaeon YP2-bin.285]|uniref:Recombinase family protein n=1 Tax=Candidatus Sysuiplasma superficiale TaxID=2823368 RepID=A0A8J7YKG0_9ARCH|nr:recombinase family protein [Candidatus Sysuiplasma superficiale]